MSFEFFLVAAGGLVAVFLMLVFSMAWGSYLIKKRD
jgi:hypothetical protein